MDNLKQVNNRHGHAVGSRILRATVANTLCAGVCASSTSSFRFGGAAEFCIVLPETAWHGALEVAERVKEAISAPAVPRGRDRAGRADVGASLGIASFPLHARDGRPT
jgi:diguanylate cyclase (GGDEF)-like protein